MHQQQCCSSNASSCVRAQPAAAVCANQGAGGAAGAVQLLSTIHCESSHTQRQQQQHPRVLRAGETQSAPSPCDAYVVRCALRMSLQILTSYFLLLPLREDAGISLGE